MGNFDLINTKMDDEFEYLESILGVVVHQIDENINVEYNSELLRDLSELAISMLETKIDYITEFDVSSTKEDSIKYIRNKIYELNKALNEVNGIRL